MHKIMWIHKKIRILLIKPLLQTVLIGMKYTIDFFVVLPGILLLSGCSLLTELDDLHVSFPEYPSAWRIRWLSDIYMVEETIVSDADGLMISVAREIPLVAAAWPVDTKPANSWNPRPAGYIAGLQMPRPSSIRTNWVDGFGALFLLELAAEGMDLREFNTGRFVQALQEVSQGGNPWNIDKRKLVSDIAADEFWVYSIKLLETVDITLPLAPGTWQADYLESLPLIVGQNGIDAALVEGMHSFLRIEDKKVAQVWVSAKDTPVVWFE